MNPTRTVAVVVTVAILVGASVIAFAFISGSNDDKSLFGENEAATVTEKRFCSVAQQTNGTRLVALATEREVGDLVLLAQGYERMAPKGIRDDVAVVVAYVESPDDRAPRTVNQAAARVDAWVAGHCDGEGK